MKKIAFLVFSSAVCLILIGLFHYFDLPLSEWTRPLIIIPLIYAGVYFRRAGSVSTMYILLISQGPFMLLEFSRSINYAMNYVAGTVASGAAGIFIGHVIQRQRVNAEAMKHTHGVIESVQHDVDADSLLSALEKLFREHGQSDMVDIYMFDENKNLKKRGEPDCRPLSEDHLFYEVAERREFMASANLREDHRIRYVGPETDKDKIQHIAVFPIEYGGRVRGVISLANTADEHFGGDKVSFLNAVKQSIESVLEIDERNQIAIQHEIQCGKIRDTFSSYVSRTVAEEILKDPDKLDLGGKLQDVTIMFAEVTNFIQLLATLDPNELISMLNEYFSVAMDTIFEFEGTLDKFIEDNVMAFWGAPLPVPDSEERAVRCAQKLQQEISRLNQTWDKQDKPQFQVCIGINSGPVIAGNIGSIRRMEYTVIGDTVNLAARIKSLSSTRNIPILMSETTYKKVKDMFHVENQFQATVKGKTDEIAVYQLQVDN